jgi:hypothetical protein
MQDSTVENEWMNQQRTYKIDWFDVYSEEIDGRQSCLMTPSVVSYKTRNQDQVKMLL